ncbi:MAG: hypothetical protein WCO45_03390 [Pseudanabaena sp. ELA607]
MGGSMNNKLASYTLFYPQNQAFIRGASSLPERLMIIDGAYRAFQMPLLLMIGLILMPFILAQALIGLAKILKIPPLSQVAILIQLAGFGMIGLAALNVLSVFFNPVLFQWVERIWIRNRASQILQNGGEVIDGWVLSVNQDSDQDWRIEFKLCLESDSNVYSITIPYLPASFSQLENGSVLKFLRDRQDDNLTGYIKSSNFNLLTYGDLFML